MKKLTMSLLAVLVVTSMQSLKAQTVDEIVNKHIAAIGGKEKLLSLKSVKKTGSINTEGFDVGVVVTAVNGVGSRNDITVPNMGEGFQITNATKGWEFMPFMGQATPEAYSEGKVKFTQYLLDLQGLLVNYKEKGNQVELLGKEKVDTSECYQLKITTKSGNIFTEFIDVATGYNIKTIAKAANGEEEVVTNYSNFKKTADGLVFPFSQTIPRGTINFSMIEVNQPVDETIFTSK
ncbi:MAG: hypothetical protein ABIN94_07680 [Ferruginibacter sp.]